MMNVVSKATGVEHVLRSVLTRRLELGLRAVGYERRSCSFA
jgi:hypothetical protein